MSISTRLRFEIFKRDSYTCRYCGGKSPEVVLEVDHIVPRCNGGTDDALNLVTSCYECNRGKAGVPLSDVMTGEDPHDKAIEIIEKRRQIDEYNRAAADEREKRCHDHDFLVDYWKAASGSKRINPIDSNWLFSVLRDVPAVLIQNAMDVAIKARQTNNFAYLGGVVRRMRDEEGI